MTLHDTIRYDALTVFCNADDFAEPVVYHPGNGSSRAINAVVIRNQDEAFGNDELTLISNVTVNVKNDVSTGISAEEIDEGQDKIAVTFRGNVELLTIMAIIGEDEGMLELQCR